MSKKEKTLIIILTILIIIITSFTIFILINKKKNIDNIDGSYNLEKEEIIDIVGNITTIPSKNYSFTIKDKEINFCFKKEKKCLTTTCIVKGNKITLGNLEDESLSGEFIKTITNNGMILEKKLSTDTTIKYYYIKKQG